MHPLLKAVSPSATNFLRTDHAAVAAAFRPYSAHLPGAAKAKLGEAICLALINHTRLEEEIFYPAVRQIDPDTVAKSIPEHAELARLIAELRRMDATEARYDATLTELKRKVTDHVAEEESRLFPHVEQRLDPDRNRELGARMSGRRVELLSPNAGALMQQLGFSMPSRTFLLSVGAALVAGVLAARTVRRPTHHRDV